MILFGESLTAAALASTASQEQFGPPEEQMGPAEEEKKSINMYLILGALVAGYFLLKK